MIGSQNAGKFRGQGAEKAAVGMPEVSLCIPAWQSEPFIAKTLDHALAQTYPNIRILVSIDKSDDKTAAICQSYAQADPRIRVHVQSERLGWVGNVNYLLDQVRTEFYSLYFHDDVIEPRYVERLLEALQRRPDAISVHCDMGHFGSSKHVSLGVDYPDSAAQRLAWFLVAPNRGSPLRSLTRSKVLAAGLRLPTDAVDGLWANEPYLMRLLAAGPALRVPETLYMRWDKRAGGLTDGWRKLTLEQRYASYRANTENFISITDAAASTEAERRALQFCVYVHVMPQIRALEMEHATAATKSAGDIHPAFASIDGPRDLASLGTQLEAWALERYAYLQGIERNLPGQASKQ